MDKMIKSLAEEENLIQKAGRHRYVKNRRVEKEWECLLVDCSSSSCY